MNILRLLAIAGCVTFAVCCLHASAGNAGRIAEIASFLPEKPCTVCPPADDRAAWDGCMDGKTRKKTVSAAEKILKDPIPECPDELYLDCIRTGNRKRYEAPYFRRIGNLSQLVFAECIENKGRFAEKANACIAAICGERSWTMPAHDIKLSNFNGTGLTIDLGSSHRALAVSYALALLGGRVPAELRRKALSELDRRVFDVYLAKAENPGSKGNSWWHGRANWNPVCHSSVVRAALAVVEDRVKRARFVAAEEEAAPYYLSGFADGGWCPEGMGYWNYGFSAHLLGGLAIRAATGGKVDIFAHPKTRKVAEAGYTMQLAPGVPPDFSDGGGARPSAHVRALVRQVYPDLTSPGVEKCRITSGGFHFFVQRAFGQEPPAGKFPAYRLPVRSWFPDKQVLLCRPNDGGRLHLGVKGGNNGEPHNHNDLGSYALLLDGVPCIGDPGGEVYTRRTFSKDRYVSKVLNSYGHPVPVVDGGLQKTGWRFAARLLDVSLSEDCDRLVLDLSGGYGNRDITKLVRTFTYNRKDDTVTISDEVLLSKPGKFEVPLVTHYGAEITDDGKALVMENRNGAKIKAAISADAAFTVGKEVIPNPGRKDVLRYAVRITEPCTSCVITTAISCVGK